jgi:AraC-like DNA-binding protein
MPPLSDNITNGPLLARVAGKYRERPPTEALRAVVRRVWRNTLRGAARPLLVVPDGCIDLLSVDGALLIAGPDTGPIIEAVAFDATILGIRFQPGAAPAWLGIHAGELVNKRVPLADVWGRRAEELAERLFETGTTHAAFALLEQTLARDFDALRSPDHRDRQLRHALHNRLMTEERHVRDLAIDLGMSERSVRRRCQELFGYGAKTFTRILRFQRFLSRVQAGQRLPLSTLATACGYADQAHLSREVRRLTGLTPAAVVAQFALGV